MNDLAEFLFPAPAKRSVGGIVAWWERRRLPYNLIVGGAGVFTLAAVKLITLLPPAVSFRGFWIPVVAYGVLANVCYTLGPALEIAVEKLFGREVLPIGPALYRMGLTFSLGLTLLPVLLVTIGWIVRIVVGLG